MSKIILASSSPRRQMLMKQIGLPFTVRISNIDESHCQTSPSDLVKELSLKKATSILFEIESEMDSALIIGADTVVSLSDKILGKPSDEREAFDMLKELQGRKHIVYTGVSLILKSNSDNRVTSLVDSAYVFMRDMTDREIWTYIKTGEPLDKAGAYGVQEKGAFWIERIEGDYYTVMGLPLSKLYLALQEFSIDPTEYW